MSAEQPKDEGTAGVEKASPGNEVAKKASRTQMTPLQKEVLEASYTLNPFPPAEHKRSLGERIGLDEKQISTWFSGRRRKDKKTEDSSASAGPHPPHDAAPPAAPPQASPAPAPAAAAPQQPLQPSLPHQASPAAPPPHSQQTPMLSAAPSPPAGPAGSGVQTAQIPSAQQPGAQLPGASAPGVSAPAGVGTTAGLPGLGTLPGTALSPASLPGLPGLGVPGLQGGGVLPQLQPPPPQGLALPPPGSLMQQQQQQLVQLLQQQPHLLQQQPHLLHAVAHPQLLQQMLLQQHPQQQQQQQQQQQRPPSMVQPAGLASLPGLGPMFPPQQQQQPRPNLPPGAMLPGLPGLGLPSSSHAHLQQQQQQQPVGMKLEGLPPEALRALQEAAKATLPQPYREDGPPLGWDFDELPQAAIEAGVGGKHRRSEPIASAGPASKAPRTADQSGTVHRGIPPLSSADKSRLRAEEREQKRLDAIKERERKNEEKKKEREDKKREREMMRANERQEKLLSKGKGVQAQAGPPDDLDLEWSRLLEEQQRCVGATPTTIPSPAVPGGPNQVPQQQQLPIELPPPERPEFPPASLNLAPAFAPEVGTEVGTEVLMVAAFLNSFSDVLGMAPPPSADQIAQAVHDGQDSLLLGAIHISMLRLVQADMEEAHASGAASVSAAGPGSAGHHFDRAMISAAHMLEGCWGWGYDMDSWRAHLNALTWPEVLRQLAVVGTLGSPRQKQGRGRRPSNVHKAKMGVEGEDVVEDEQGNLKLRLPNRLGIGTVKAASWQVLAEVGPEGLPIAEMAHRIHESGLRDFKYTKQPEATVAGALARDVLFTRVGPAQYALSSIIKHKLNATSAQDGAGPEGKTEGMDVDEHDGQRANQQQGAPEGTEEGDSGGEDDDDEGGNEDRGGTGEGGRPGASQPKAPWVGVLAASDYDALNVGERLAALAWLIHTVCDSPTVRLLLDARVDQAINDKKEIVEMGKEIKKKRLEDAYVKSRAAADVASKKMAELQAVGGSLPGYPPPAAMPLNFDPQLAGAASAAAQRAMEDAAVAARLVSEVAKDDSEEEKLAHQRRMDALARVDEETAIQLQPLGMDRRYNRYWRVAPVGCDSGEVALGAQDPGIGRVFVEAADGSSWRLIQQPEQLDGLSAALDPRGAREGGLAAALNRLGPAIKRAMPAGSLTVDLRGASTSGPACPGAGPLQQHQQQHLARQLRFVRPQATLFPASAEVKPLVGEPVRPSKLKEDVLRIGAALPESALHFDFDRAAWQQAVLQASNPLALRQCVGRLEASVVPDYLSAAYNRNPQILKAAWSSAQRQQQEAEALVATSAEGAPSEADQQLAMEEPLSWLPPTYAAVALRLQALDAALYFAPQTRCGRDRLAGYRYVLRPAPVPRPTALEQLRQQMQQQQQQQQQQQHPEQQQNQQQPQQQGEGIASRCDVLTSGMVPLAYGGTLTAHGRLKPALFFPELPLAFMSRDQRAMHLPLEQLRAAVAEAAAAGCLVPPTHASAADGAAAAAAAAGEGRGGRSAAAAHDAIQAQKCERKDAMVRASAAVRSLASRVASARGSSKHDKFAKARSHKAKKVRQSNLSKQLAREKGGIGSEEEGPDYGEGYDDGFEEMDMLGGENANGE